MTNTEARKHQPRRRACDCHACQGRPAWTLGSTGMTPREWEARRRTAPDDDGERRYFGSLGR